MKRFLEEISTGPVWMLAAVTFFTALFVFFPPSAKASQTPPNYPDVFIEMGRGEVLLEATLRIIEEEGFRYCAYWDVEGYALGYGAHIGKPVDPKTTCTSRSASIVFVVQRMEDNAATLESALPFYKSAPARVQLVLLDMAYQMGVARLFKFKRTLKLLSKKEYLKAADRILKSRYAKQTPNRAKRNAQYLRQQASKDSI